MIPNWATGYQRHGIKHASASMLNKFIDAPDAWAAQYIFKHRFPFGAMPKRGQAVETGLVAVLMAGMSVAGATEKAIKQFNRETLLDNDEKRDAERENIAPMIELAVTALKDYGRAEVPQTGQEKINMICKTDDWTLPVIGYLDMRFPKVNKIVDLKTTLKMPSVMSPAHQRQRAIYAKATGDDVEFLYVTPKKFEFKADGDVDAVIAEIKTHLIRMERFLRLDEETIKNIVPVNPDTFYWRDAAHIRKELFDL